jgi:hypothetical protein
MNENEPDGGRVVVSDQPIADFSHLTAPEQLAAISRIEGVALVIVPASLAGAYAAIPTSGVAATIYVPDGANVRVHTGALMMSGDGQPSCVRRRYRASRDRGGAAGPRHRRVRGHPGRRWTAG